MKKSWKLILIALLAALLVCTCMSALADGDEPAPASEASQTWPSASECKHVFAGVDNRVSTSAPTYTYQDTTQHIVKYTVTTYCPNPQCNAVLGTQIIEEAKPHNATPVPSQDIAATCTKAGRQAWVCADCGLFYKDGVKGYGKLGHLVPESDWDIVSEQNGCIEQPYRVGQCVRPGCGETVKEKYGAELNHHNYIEHKQEATCYQEGYYYMECSVCGDRINDKGVTPKQAHVGTGWVTIVKPGCLTSGTEQGVCQWCKITMTRDIAPHGHILGDPKTVKEATCTEPGVAKTQCKECGEYFGEMVIPANGHTQVEIVAGTAAAMPGCTTEGTSTTYTYCKVCGAILKGTKTPVPALGHQFEYNDNVGMNGNAAPQHGTTLLEATCTQRGIIRIWCSRPGCDAYKDFDLPMIDHVHYDNDANWHSDGGTDDDGYPATCYSTGLAVNYCVNCGGDPQYKTIPKKDHRYAAGKDYNSKGDKMDGFVTVLSAPTCTKDGSVLLTCLNKCGETTAVTVPAPGHKWGKDDYINGETPTCTKAVIVRRICQTCGEVENKVLIPALGHLIKQTSPSTVEPTCTKAGLLFGYCERCDKEISGEVIPALGHKAGAPVVTAATCTAEGKTETKCTVCGAVIESTAIPKIDHKPVDKVVTEATTSKEGLIETRCSVCNTLLGTKAIPKKAGSSSGSTGSGSGSSTPAAASTVVTGTINAVGISAAELGGNGTALVTPIDLSVDGTYTYSLVANGQYVVGTVTFVVSNGTFTASYSAPAVKVSAESLIVFANVDALKAGTATAVGFNAIFDAAGDTKVIVAISIVGNFDTTAAAPYVADAAQIATMRTIVD